MAPHPSLHSTSSRGGGWYAGLGALARTKWTVCKVEGELPEPKHPHGYGLELKSYSLPSPLHPLPAIKQQRGSHIGLYQLRDSRLSNVTDMVPLACHAGVEKSHVSVYLTYTLGGCTSDRPLTPAFGNDCTCPAPQTSALTTEGDQGARGLQVVMLHKWTCKTTSECSLRRRCNKHCCPAPRTRRHSAAAP